MLKVFGQAEWNILVILELVWIALRLLSGSHIIGLYEVVLLNFIFVFVLESVAVD
jgi:hypothetical protein